MNLFDINPFQPNLHSVETKIADKVIVVADSDIFGVNQITLPMSKNAFDSKLDSWKSGSDSIQSVFTELTPEQREFLLSGMPLDAQEDFFEE